jgi:hypothetical protein
MPIDQAKSECNEELVRGYLDRELTAAEEIEVEAHLDQCLRCRRLISDSAAEQYWWSNAKTYLKPDDLDQIDDCALPPTRSSPAAKVDLSHNVIVRQIKEWLDPTDDPKYIGRFGGYEILGVVGFGGMGVVLKGFEPSLNRYVAIKVLSPALATSGAARQRFAREAQAAAAVLHENVLAIHRVDESHALPYLVTPFVSGVSLQKRIDTDGPLPPTAVLRIGRQIAAGLAAAHAQGLVHRDIKPANILLDRGVERVTITDFGLARAADDGSLTKTGVIAGTPQYMSPEQARGDSVDQRSDLFSLGSVLYAMCTGHAPFRAESNYGVLRRITDEEPRPIHQINPLIPQWLCRIITRLMSKDPGERFNSAGEVAQLLEACLAHVQQPTAVPLPAQLEAAQRAAGRARSRWPIGRWLAAAAIGLLALLAGVVVVLELNKGTLTIESDADDVSVRITQGDRLVEELTVTRAGEQIRVAAGTYLVEIDSETDGIAVENGIVKLPRGETEIVRIVRDTGEDARTVVDKTGPVEAAQELATYDDFQPNGVPPRSAAEKAIVRLVLVFADHSRRVIPCVLVNAGSQTLVVTTGPAATVPDGAPPAIDRAFLVIQGRASVDAHYMRESTAELFVYRTDGGLTNYRPDDRLELAVGDVLSAMTTGTNEAPQPPRTRGTARVVALDQKAGLSLSERKIDHQFDGLVEIDRSLPEGTPLFKNGRLAGLTLLGTRFLGGKVSKSYVVPVERVAGLCRDLTTESAGNDAQALDSSEESLPPKAPAPVAAAAPDAPNDGEPSSFWDRSQRSRLLGGRLATSADVASAEAELSDAERNVNYSERLVKRGFLTQSQFQQEQRLVEVAKARLDRARREYEAQKRLLQLDVDSAELQVKRAQAALKENSGPLGDVQEQTKWQFALQQAELELERAQTLLALHTADQRQSKSEVKLPKLEVPDASEPMGAETDANIWRIFGVRASAMSKVGMPGDRFNGGLIIRDIRQNGPAAKAGLQKGDIIIGVGKWETLSPANLLFALKSDKSADDSGPIDRAVKVLFLRKAELGSTTVTLE